ncbi:MAG: long-chain fatty acid--CoA ligase, partial [Flavobacterium sp.]|nr:long-chain fatty acid--CoA ligase [Flavobacterium sp.]
KMNLDAVSNEELCKNEAVNARIQRDIETFNAEFGNWEKIKKFRLLPAELTIENNELTPTLKLKRKIIHAKYASQIEDIYKD